MRKQFGIYVIMGWMALCGAARADVVTFDFIGEGYATDISADGSVVAGNTQGVYETFRWTESEGVVPLGLATAILGSGAGTPDISDDGTKISATILGADSTYITQGVWTEGSGWQETMPPPPPDGGLLDNAYGSAWGLSGDGQTLVGLYWRPGQPGGSAHACSWTEATGVLDLGAEFGNSRANDANYDGSVIVGWDESDFGHWRPTVWVDGVRTTIAEYEHFLDASAVNPDGTIIGGQALDIGANLAVAALWRWNGSVWEEEQLGALPGTFGGSFGLATVNDMSADGSMVVGYNQFSSPFNATGFIWTEEAGLIDVADFLADNGVVVDPSFDILSLQGISDDGKIMVGIGQDITPPFTARSFIIRVQSSASTPDGLTSADVSGVAAWPNPARDGATLAFDLSRDTRVSLEIVDASGKSVCTLLRGWQSAGRVETQWNGRDGSGREMPSGVYFYRLDRSGHTETRKLTLVH